MSVPLCLGLLLLLAPQTGPAGEASPAIAPGPSFEELWSAFVRADAAGDEAGAERALREVRRARVERNVPDLDTIGLALVERGAARLDAGQRDVAEASFRSAVDLAPGLPDGHSGLGAALLRKGPLGVVPSVRATAAGLSGFLATGRGVLRSRTLATVAALLAAFAFAWGLGVALLLRHGGLLRHDIEEWLGPGQSRASSFALFLLVLLLPVATFQGWGWLPLWWVAVLFPYLEPRERVLGAAVLAGALAAGPLASSLDVRLRTARNPLFHAALRAVEAVPGPADARILEEAAAADPGDRELQYLVALARRRAGRYEEAAGVYRRILTADPADAVARNNLANLEFARGGYDSARARYREGTAAGNAPEVAATSFYNLSLVHLQKFEYQAYNEAKSNADRLAPGLVADYDRWRYESGDYAAVDLVVGSGRVFERFRGAESGVAASLANRFTASVAVLALAAFLVARWRGPKAFTLHCRRCGTPFCRSCHLGQVSGGLCTQCYHLFVVRDGVSAPARNRKMAEVQRASARRERVFRALSILSPGAGQIYGGWTARGAALMAAWYAVAALLVASWRLPLTEVSSRVAPPWAPLAAGLVLLLAWAAANRFRPSSEVELPSRPAGPRRPRAAAV